MGKMLITYTDKQIGISNISSAIGMTYQSKSKLTNGRTGAKFTNTSGNWNSIGAVDLILGLDWEINMVITDDNISSKSYRCMLGVANTKNPSYYLPHFLQ